MRVVHHKKERYDLYIGRPSIFGNPFVIGIDGTRLEVIAKFEEYARSNLMNEIRQLEEGTILGCWCSPLPCHGNIIIKLWKEIHNK